MALDRTKFKATSVAATMQKDAELNSSLGRDGDRAEYLKWNNGSNLVRIYPPHPEGGDVFAEPKVTVWLPIMTVQRDSNHQEIIDPKTRRPLMKEGAKSVFNSRIHGGTPKDLVEEYIAYSRSKLLEEAKMCQDPKEKVFIQEKIEAITGNFTKKIQGLKYKQAWVMYADHIIGGVSKFGMFEIGPSIKDRLNSIAASTDSSNDPLATDPFTDVETGRAIIVTYNKEAQKSSDYYKVELDNAIENTTIGGKIYPLPRMFPLTDEQLEKYLKVTPLSKRFRNVFKRRDFDLQLEGLEFFDQKNSIGTFSDPKWIEICEEISSYYPEDNQENEENEDVEDNPIEAAQETNVSETAEGDKFFYMTRKELSDYSKINKTGLIIKPTLTDEDIRNSLRVWEEAQMNESEEEDSLSQKESEDEETSVVSDVTAQQRLAAMRARMKGK